MREGERKLPLMSNEIGKDKTNNWKQAVTDLLDSFKCGLLFEEQIIFGDIWLFFVFGDNIDRV